MANDAHSSGVPRDEFYRLMALLFFSLFGLVAVLSFEPTREYRTVCNMILFTTFAGAGAWFMSIAARERKRLSELAPEATSHRSE
jgi:hypothetical protein